MSRTDKDRPEWVRAADPLEPTKIQHDHYWLGREVTVRRKVRDKHGRGRYTTQSLGFVSSCSVEHPEHPVHSMGVYGRGVRRVEHSCWPVVDHYRKQPGPGKWIRTEEHKRKAARVRGPLSQLAKSFSSSNSLDALDDFDDPKLHENKTRYGYWS